MSETGKPSSKDRPVVLARIANTRRINGKVQDAEFPIHLKQNAEVLVQREGRDSFLAMVEYGQSTAECRLSRSDLVFA